MEDLVLKSAVKVAQMDELTEEELANSYVLQNLNKGKTWVGWISQNNGGTVSSN